ncbi:MAG: STAS domain-containing protein [Candidatus Hydrogenedentota bacterium]|nr:MAG: STAS domain-containing protein [Candidatus Hydrogenedentota bacterium]
MLAEKKENLWRYVIEPGDNQLGLINTVRYLEKENEEIEQAKIPNHIVEIDLKELQSVNSEIIAQFVNLQSTLVQTGGKLKLVNVNPELKSSFDVVMLDKIIFIQYFGFDEKPDSSEE